MINKIRSEFKAEILLAAEAHGVSCKFNDDERKCTIKENREKKALSSSEFAKAVALNTKYEVTYINTRGQYKINYVNGDFDIVKIYEFILETTAPIRCLTIKPTYARKS